MRPSPFWPADLCDLADPLARDMIQSAFDEDLIDESIIDRRDGVGKTTIEVERPFSRTRPGSRSTRKVTSRNKVIKSGWPGRPRCSFPRAPAILPFRPRG